MMLPTNLLGAVRTEHQRLNAPAVVAVKQRRADRQGKFKFQSVTVVSRLRRFLGVLRQMLVETRRLRELRDSGIVLAGDGDKCREVSADLFAAGMAEEDVLLVPELKRRFKVTNLFSGRNKILTNLAAWCYLCVRCRAPVTQYFEVICLYAVFIREMTGMPKSFWLVIGDLSPQQIALAAAAKTAGHKTISWQYDYLDFKLFPVKPDIAVVLNTRGVKLARMEEPDKGQGRVLWRRLIDRTPVQLQGLSEKSVGVLLNAFADRQVLDDRLVKIHQVLGSPLHLRLHPRSDLDQVDLPDGLVLRPAGETMEEFVDSVGVIVCGNTSAQFKALCLGGPVVQISGLDPIPFDHHGYVEKGLVLGVQDISSLSIERVREFYLMSTFERGIQEILGPKDGFRSPSLSHLRELVTSEC